MKPRTTLSRLKRARSAYALSHVAKNTNINIVLFSQPLPEVELRPEFKRTRERVPESMFLLLSLYRRPRMEHTLCSNTGVRACSILFGLGSTRLHMFIVFAIIMESKVSAMTIQTFAAPPGLAPISCGSPSKLRRDLCRAAAHRTFRFKSQLLSSSCDMPFNDATCQPSCSASSCEVQVPDFL